MNRTLRLLMWMRLNGRVRLYLNRFGAIRSVFLSIIAIILGVLWLGAIVVAIIFGQHRSKGTFLDMVDTWGAPLILGAWVLTLLVGGKGGALAFTAADTDQLFPGPFRRRELVLYRICVQSFGALISGIFAGLWLIMNAGTPLGGWLSLVLLMLFLQYSNIAMSIAREAGGNRLRIGVGLPVLAGVAYLAVKTGAINGDFSQVVPTLRTLRDSPIVSKLLLPLEPFGRAMAATDTPTALVYLVGCLGLVLLLIALILRLDSVSLEASLAASQKMQEKLERLRGKRAVFRPTSRVELPMPPLMGRAAPLAWRQLSAVVRSGAWLLIPIGGVAGYLCAGIEAEGTIALIPGFAMMLAFFLPNLLRFDFRSDLDQIDLLKALPLAPSTVAVGQIAAPVCSIALMSWFFIAGVALRNPAYGLAAAPVALVAPLAGLLLMTCENILFLIYPYRVAASSVIDVRHMLRGMVGQFAKGIAVLVTGAPAALVAWGVLAADLGPFAAAGAAAVVLALECLGLLFVLAWAFNRFDPSRDLPA